LAVGVQVAPPTLVVPVPDAAVVDLQVAERVLVLRAPRVEVVEVLALQ
jgi:hypothetical protein